ncbi:uncharacterized protein DNG_05724 [Cephalotrichum gorgonifer]|uniref:GPI inositol-deacylase n=1 Tax=Cephalotrichum gorgonifer TaxID=2041049 RepID=A0AAE8SVS9_9PEZI|nr:uncharacterized protein DNG_05724 [Cephalotrichum gorgonifer]
MEPHHSLRPSSTASTATSSRSLLARAIARRDTKTQEPNDTPKGPLGLTTIYEPVDAAIVDLEWLPKDAAFRDDVRIHTFGYSSAIARESSLNLHDFARQLLAAITDAPAIPHEDSAKLIFVSHSMGGLVVKKAFILGHHISEFQPIVDRVCAIFFLATPHQGADIAQTLSRLVSLVPGSRPFINDLFPQSPVLQSINDEFPRYIRDIQLFSFWETKPMNYGIKTGVIVEKQSAVMNYLTERRTHLDANHRDVARYSSLDDPSYLGVRNALATAIDGQRRSTKSMKQIVDHEGQSAINQYLGVSDVPEDDIMTQDSLRLPGSSGHIVNHLRKSSLDCCFFFFVERDNTKATINAFLRSIAWQMAMLHPEILGKINEITSGWRSSPLDKIDYNLVWRQLFLAGILKVKLKRPQYWVIDAMDECRGSSDFVAFLARAQEQWPLSVLVTSRTTPEAHMASANPRVNIRSEAISDEDTRGDISLFLSLNIGMLPTVNRNATRQEMADEILQSSRGCFLWAYLVFRELRHVHTSAEARRVLGSTPSDMGALYQKVLDDMSNAEFGKSLTQAILTWAIYSFRPLSTEEVRVAIELDIDDNIDDIVRSITECGGNLVYIDSRQRLQLLHATAKEFLTRKDISSDMVLTRAEGHSRLAMVCLKHLMSRDAKVRRLSVPQGVDEPNPFHDYACNFVFQHFHNISSSDDEAFKALAKFLESPHVLGWIEYIAAHSDLQRVFQAGKTIANLLNRRAQHTPPMSLRREIALLQKWANDLTHLVTKFSRRLRLCPSAIHHLIPPFCPRDSAVRKQFTSTRGMTVQGLSASGWDDCLVSISFPKGMKPTIVACGPGRFAVGMVSGKVVVYDDSIFQEVQELDHKEPVWCLAFGETDRYLASASAKSIKVWDLNVWQELYKFPVQALCISMTFTENDSTLLLAMRNNQLICADLVQGSIQDDPIDWTRDFGEEGPELQFKQPTMAAMNPTTGFLAVVYRGEDMVIWDIAQDGIHDIYEKETGSRANFSNKIAGGSATVRALTFSQAEGTNLLATTYFDGDLYVYNTETGEPIANMPGANAMVLTSSPDGRTLAGSDSRGSIILFDFETLKFLYRIQFDNSSIIAKSLAITTDNLRLVEVRGNQCRVWEPPVLLRQDMDDEQSDSVSLSTGPQEIDYEASDALNITAIACVRAAPIVFYGKEDGSVHACDISGEPQSQQLFVQTTGCPIKLIHFDEAGGVLSCGDLAGRVTGRTVVRRQRNKWDVSSPLVDIWAGCLLTQVLVSKKHSHLLLSSEKHDTLWPIPKQGEGVWVERIGGRREPRWLSHPSNHDILLLIGDREAQIYSWTNLQRLASVSLSASPDSSIERLIPLQGSQRFITYARDTSTAAGPSQSAGQVWDLSKFVPDAEAVTPMEVNSALVSKAEVIIGVFASRLIFLTGDYWVCSISIESSEDIPVRHFFIPNDWISVVNQLVMGVGKGGEIIFMKQSELAVIKRGLEVTETGAIFRPGRGHSPRPSVVPLRSGRPRPVGGHSSSL